MATTQAAPAVLPPGTFVGSDELIVRGQGTQPTGAVHLVDGSWRPLCGAPRVRFVFPGADAGSVTSCAGCAEALHDGRRANGGERAS